MREIKFRAWNKTENGWYNNHYGLMIDGEDGSVLMNEVCNEESEVILMQFTGLKDKNGKEIYEGDIVKSHSKGDELMEVRFKDGMFCFDGSNRMYFIDLCNTTLGLEVIGNIYENPELLEK